MRRNIVETVLGALVLAIAAAFLVFAIDTADVRNPDGYALTARFLRVGGLEPGADVRISGVKVGTVLDRRLDSQAFEAVVELSIDRQVQLPADTEAVVTSDGVFGGKYLRLIPGAAAEKLPPGGEITSVRDFKTLEDTVSEIIFLATGNDR